jgi:hypothetical protein
VSRFLTLLDFKKALLTRISVLDKNENNVLIDLAFM